MQLDLQDWLKDKRIFTAPTPEEQARINQPSSGLRFYRPEWQRQMDCVQAQ